MKLSEIKNHLQTTESVNFKLASGSYVPNHFHVTEIGVVNKHFIDCGGTERFEKVASFQLWNASDTGHRLKPQKLLHIIALSEKVLDLGDLEIEVEYQSDTIGKYALDFDGKDFELLPKQTNCLASDECGIPGTKQKAELQNITACCAPASGCC